MLDLNRIHNMDCLDGMRLLPDGCVHCCVTSPPYFGLRDYGVQGQIGLELTPEAYLSRLVEVFREVRRVLRDDGTLWLNLGNSYAGSGKGSAAYPEHAGDKQESNKGTVGCQKITAVHYDREPKNLLGIPWRVAFALQADGWYLRSDIIWAKTNQMPESVKDRPTKAHEYLFLLSKNRSYYYDAEAIAKPVADSTANDLRVAKEDFTDRRPEQDYVGSPQQGSGMLKPSYTKVPAGWDQGEGAHGTIHRDGRTIRYGGKKYTENPDQFNRTKSGNIYKVRPYRNKRTVWTLATQPFKEAHFATFPEKLVEPCILAGCPAGGVVLDPFMGSGTTAKVALENGRKFLWFELNPKYMKIAEKRLTGVEMGLPLAIASE